MMPSIFAHAVFLEVVYYGLLGTRRIWCTRICLGGPFPSLRHLFGQLHQLEVLSFSGVSFWCTTQVPNSSSISMQRFQMHFPGGVPYWRITGVPSCSLHYCSQISYGVYKGITVEINVNYFHYILLFFHPTLTSLRCCENIRTVTRGYRNFTVRSTKESSVKFETWKPVFRLFETCLIEIR